MSQALHGRLESLEFAFICLSNLTFLTIQTIEESASACWHHLRFLRPVTTKQRGTGRMNSSCSRDSCCRCLTLGLGSHGLDEIGCRRSFERQSIADLPHNALF